MNIIMATRFNIEVNVDEVLHLAHSLTPRAMQNAWRRTLKKTGKYLQSQVAKKLSPIAQIPQKVIKQRLYYFVKSLDKAKVWLGLEKLAAERLGKARQTKKGVKVGKHLFEKAFYRKNKVFRRVGSARLPIERVLFDFGDKGEAAFQDGIASAEQRLLTILRQEINFELIRAR